jgi:hypothetical protein
MSCYETLLDYGLRSVGIGERLLPRENITLCEQFILIGSGLIWNIYFAVLALILGFFIAIGTRGGKGQPERAFVEIREHTSFLYFADRRSLSSSFWPT